VKVHLHNVPKNFNHATIKRAVMFFSETLMSKRMCNSLTVTIKFSETHKQENFEDGCCTWEDDYVRPKEFTIILHSYRSQSKVLTTLAHELVHVKQFATSELRDMIKSAHVLSWRGHKYDTRKLSYWDYPWEIDAHGRELGLYIRFRDMMDKEKEDAKKAAKAKKSGSLKSKAAAVPQKGRKV